MAIPSFNLNLSTISTCDTVTGWSAGVLEPDIKKQGTNSLVTSIRDGNGTSKGVVTYSGGPFNMSAPDTHLRLWLFHSFAGFLQTKINGGIRLFVSDGTNENEYYVGGSDTHDGAWELFSADLANPDVNGGANLSSITSCGFKIVHLTTARNVDNTYWDYFVYGTGYDIYGGTNGDPITWKTIASADAANGYGLVLLENGIQFINGKVNIGDSVGTNSTFFDGSNDVNVFYDTGESSSLYAINLQGNATGTTDIVIDNTVIKSSATPYEFFSNSSTVTSLNISGTQYNGAGDIILQSGQTVENSVFIKCGQLNPSTSVFQRNSFFDATDPTGAIKITDTTNISGLSFSSGGAGHAIYIDVPGTYNFTNFSYTGYGANDTNDAALYNNSGGAVIINVSGQETPTVRNGVGSTTTVNNPTKFTVSNLIDGSEVRILQQLDLIELAGVESVGPAPTGINAVTVSTDPINVGRYRVTYNYNHSIDIPIFLVIFKESTISVYQSLTLTVDDSSFFAVQQLDRQYIV